MKNNFHNQIKKKNDCTPAEMSVLVGLQQGFVREGGDGGGESQNKITIVKTDNNARHTKVPGVNANNLPQGGSEVRRAAHAEHTVSKPTRP